MLTDPDIQLMLNFKAGDQRAFQQLFDKHKKRVINYCFRYCGHPQVAEELAQETFLRVYKAASRYRPQARFSTWLYKIAANVCLNEIRKPVYRARLESIDPPAPEDAHASREIAMEPDQSQPDLLLEAHQNEALVRSAMSGLSDDQRSALLLRVTEGFSYLEIANQINRSENHVKTLIHRGRQRLKKILGAYWGNDAH
jgi:RNA polymerase sigma-70 factor (ECF subfamily)